MTGLPEVVIEQLHPHLLGIVDNAVESLGEGADPRNVLSTVATTSYMAGYGYGAEIIHDFNKKTEAGLRLLGAAERFVEEVAETQSLLAQAKDQERSKK